MTVFVVIKDLVNVDDGGETVQSSVEGVFQNKVLADNYIYMNKPKRVMSGYLEERYRVQPFHVREDL